MLISKAMNDKLNEQITHELGASQTYLAMACMCDGLGLKMLAAFFRRQSDEERSHGLKILDYILEVGGKVALQPLPAPPASWDSVPAAFEASVAYEQTVTKQINDLVALAEEQRDHATRGFLQWFVDEQVEEVSSMSHMVDVCKMAGPNLLLLEGYVARMAHQSK